MTSCGWNHRCRRWPSSATRTEIVSCSWSATTELPAAASPREVRIARVTRAAWIATAAVALVALSSATALAQTRPTVTLTGGTLYHTEDVAPNSIKTFKVTCPPGYVAMSGSATDADGATQLKSVPAGARSWTFSFGLPVTAGRSSHVTVVVLCSKPRPFLPGVAGKVKIKVKLSTVKSKPVSIPPGQTEETKLRCPAGAAPAGSGLEVAPVGSKSDRVRAAAVLPNGLVARETTDLPVRGGFQFAVRNRAGMPQSVRHWGRCLARRASYRRSRKKRKRRAQTRIVRALFMERALRGSNLFDRSCPMSYFPVGAGHSYATD